MQHVIVGAGPAGVVAAENLRKYDPDSKITLISGEADPPYSRMAIPYLLVGNIAEDGTYLRKTNGYWDDMGINVVHNAVKSVDTKASKLTLSDGTDLAYDNLLLATGAHPVKPPIPGLDTPGCHYCWTLEDARKITELAHEGAHVVLLGAGFIGCIILEALFECKVNLTVVEMGDRMVPRMLDETAGGLLKEWCEKKGVAVHTSTKITAIEANAGDIENTMLVDLDNGKQIPAHLVVVAAGVKANTEFLDGSGIDVDDGIVVDHHLRTNVPNIFAAGDCAKGPDLMTGGWSVHAIQPTSTDHGRIAALNMAGKDARYKGSLIMNVLDTLGLISVSFGAWEGVEGGESAETLDRENFRYLKLQFKGDILVGAQGLGRTEHVGVLRGLIQNATPLGVWKERLMADPHKIMDAYVDLSQ